MPRPLPILLDLTGRRVVVVGGGAVGRRKAVTAAEAGADVVVVSPTMESGLPAGVTRMERAYQFNDLVGATLVFAATNVPAVNEQVVLDARALGILVSRADAHDDDAATGDFTLPAKLVRGEITVAVSTGSAALTRLVRDELLRRIDPAWERMAGVLATVRPRLTRSRLPEARRRAILGDLATEQALRLLEREGVERLFAWVGSRHPDCPADVLEF